MTLHEAAQRMRALALAFDNEAAALLEAGFDQWRRETVFPEAVNRHIAELGESHD